VLRGIAIGASVFASGVTGAVIADSVLELEAEALLVAEGE
jgi:hypothetical protein